MLSKAIHLFLFTTIGMNKVTFVARAYSRTTKNS